MHPQPHMFRTRQIVLAQGGKEGRKLGGHPGGKGAGVEPDRIEFRQRELTLKGYTNLALANHYLTLGGEYLDRELVDAVSYKDIGGKESHSQEALFAQDEIGLTDSLTFTLGGRYDHHEIYGSHFTPRGYLVYEMNELVTVKGGVSPVS